MKKGLLKALALLTMLTLLVATAAFAGADEAEGGVIRFAVSAPLTGDMAEQGFMEVNGAQMAVNKINAAGGVNGKMLEVVPMDDMGSPDQATIVAEKIAADDTIDFVLAPIFSGCTMAAMPTYLKKNISVFGPANSRTDLTEQGWPNYLRICPADIHAIKAMVDYAVSEGYEKPFIFYQNGANEVSAFQIMTEYLDTEYGIAVAGSATFAPETERDFSSHIAQMKSVGADIVLLSCEYSPAALLAKQLQTAGLEISLLGLGGVSNPALIQLAGEAAEGIMCTCAFDPTNPAEGVQTFVADYAEQFGINPTDIAAWSYEIINAIAQAYEAGATSENLAAWMRENTDYVGPTGSIKFDENGDNVNAKTYILKVVDGAFTLIQ